MKEEDYMLRIENLDMEMENGISAKVEFGTTLTEDAILLEMFFPEPKKRTQPKRENVEFGRKNRRNQVF